MICLTSLTVPDSLPVDPCGAGDPEGLSNYQVPAVCTAHLFGHAQPSAQFLDFIILADLSQLPGTKPSERMQLQALGSLQQSSMPD
jgi:hypothetical protein